MGTRRTKIAANKALQRTAAPLSSRTVLENLFATVAADRAFPAAVAELTSEVIRQGLFQDFFGRFFTGLLPNSMPFRSAVKGLPAFSKAAS